MKHLNITTTIFLLILSICACKSRVSEQEVLVPKLKMIDVPSIYSSQEAQETYIAQNFWNGMDFSDSAYLQDKSAIDGFYYYYISSLMQFSKKNAKSSLVKFTDLVLKATPPLKEYFLEIIEHSLYNPNSVVRNESLYIVVLNRIITDQEFNPYLKERYREQLQLALKNRVGDTAKDFSYTTIEGKVGSLHTLPEKYTLVMFYEPDCPACETSLEYFANSNVIKLASKSFNMVAVYTGDNLESWRKSAKLFKPYWIIAHDNNMEITMERLYDRRPSPSFYLIDKNKAVILKDALPDEVVFEISTILKAQ